MWMRGNQDIDQEMDQDVDRDMDWDMVKGITAAHTLGM